MKIKTKENGITIISLAVTIIVMLILAGVVINAALVEDSGLVHDIKSEKEEQEEMIKEEQDKRDDVLKNQLKDWGF